MSSARLLRSSVDDDCRTGTQCRSAVRPRPYRAHPARRSGLPRPPRESFRFDPFETDAMVRTRLHSINAQAVENATAYPTDPSGFSQLCNASRPPVPAAANARINPFAHLHALPHTPIGSPLARNASRDRRVAMPRHRSSPVQPCRPAPRAAVVDATTSSAASSDRSRPRRGSRRRSSPRRAPRRPWPGPAPSASRR